ncbi:hypothetical protein DMENIID0001_058570 [Sergentomyia squamirostris]
MAFNSSNEKYGPETHCWRFGQRHQLPTEDVQNFMEALEKLFASCKFQCDENCKSRCILRNQFVSGLREANIRKALHEEPHLTDRKALQLAKEMEKEFTEGPPHPAIKDLDKFIKKKCYQCKNPQEKNPANWHQITIKGYASDWAQMMKALKDHGVTGLNLIGIQYMNRKKWLSFSSQVKILDRLEVIIIKYCQLDVIHSVMMNCVNTVKFFNVNGIQGGMGKVFELEGLMRLSCLEELRISTVPNKRLHIKDLAPLTGLKNLKHLILIGLENLSKCHVEVLGELTLLVSLELGDCCDLPDDFYCSTLIELKSLKRLCLIASEAVENMAVVLNALQKLPALKELELMNFRITKDIARLKNLEKLLLIPISLQSHLSDINDILMGVTELADTLKIFTLVILDDVIKFTDKLAATSSDSRTLDKSGYIKKQSVSLTMLHWMLDEDAEQESVNTPIIFIRPLTEIEKIFKSRLPKTSVKIIIRSLDEWMHGSFTLQPVHPK